MPSRQKPLLVQVANRSMGVLVCPMCDVAPVRAQQKTSRRGQVDSATTDKHYLDWASRTERANH